MGLLRFWLAMAVVFEHAALFMGSPGQFPHHIKLLNGQTAVQAFYIISGFYISLILNEKYVGRGSGWLFISNRFLRIYPIYWVMLLLTAIFQLPQLIAALRGTEPFTATIQLGMNVFLYGLEWQNLYAPIRATGEWFLSTAAMKDPRHLQPLFMLPQAWTLGVELSFYAIAIWLVRRRPSAIMGIIVASLALRVFVAVRFGLTNTPWNYRFFPFELALFLAGNLAYRLYRSSYVQKFGDASWPVIGLLLLTVVYPAIPEFTAKRWLFYTALVLTIPLLFARSKKKGWDFYIGELSYPIYISHMLILELLKAPLSGLKPGRGAVVVAGGTLLLSCGLMHWVQAPIERLRARRAQRSAPEAESNWETKGMPAT